MRPQTLINLRKNHFVVIRQVEDKKYKNSKQRQWECRCDCGRTFYATTHKILKQIQSCGCKLYHKSKECSYKRLLVYYKTKAKKKNKIWLLKDEEAFFLFGQSCVYCGIEPCRKFNVFKHKKYKKNYDKYKIRYDNAEILYNGIDRVNSLDGYTKENCVTCCTTCNQAKNDLTLEEFNEWINRIINFRISK